MEKLRKVGGGWSFKPASAKKAIKFATKIAARKYLAAKHIHCSK
jgi:hypothetical protein